MSVKILAGQVLAEKIKLDLTQKVVQAKRRPGLAAVLVGDDPASQLYVKLKEKACEEVGIDFHKYLCNRDCYGEVSQEELIGLIKFLNLDEAIDGILLQLPLPERYDSQAVIDTISRDKDADGFFSTGVAGQVTPPTIAAIRELLRATGEELRGQKALIIAKSDIYTGKLKKYLVDFNIGKIKTSRDIPRDSARYDLIIIALGRAGALRAEMVKPGSIVIDVGINKVDGKTVGDVDESVKDIAGYLSPVPGGVGPLTVACLLRNVYELAKSHV